MSTIKSEVKTLSEMHIKLLARLNAGEISTKTYIDSINHITNSANEKLVDALKTSKKVTQEIVNEMNKEYCGQIKQLQTSEPTSSFSRMRLDNMADEIKLFQYTTNLNHIEFDNNVTEIIEAQ